MGWDIRISHETVGDRARLTLEAGSEVPDEVVSTIAGAYWLSEIEAGIEEEWSGDFGEEEPNQRLQG